MVWECGGYGMSIDVVCWYFVYVGYFEVVIDLVKIVELMNRMVSRIVLMIVGLNMLLMIFVFEVMVVVVLIVQNVYYCVCLKKKFGWWLQWKSLFVVKLGVRVLLVCFLCWWKFYCCWFVMVLLMRKVRNVVMNIVFLIVSVDGCFVVMRVGRVMSMSSVIWQQMMNSMLNIWNCQGCICWCRIVYWQFFMLVQFFLWVKLNVSCVFQVVVSIFISIIWVEFWLLVKVLVMKIYMQMIGMIDYVWFIYEVFCVISDSIQYRMLVIVVMMMMMRSVFMMLCQGYVGELGCCDVFGVIVCVVVF